MSLALVNCVVGVKIKRDGNSEISQNYEQMSNNRIPLENGRIFSQEDLSFPARYFYPTYPEYTDYRYQNSYNAPVGKLAIPAEQPISSWTSAWTKLIPISSFALLYGAKAGIFIFSLLLILILGVIFTTTVCTFTPLCMISFPGLALTRNQVSDN